MLLHRYFNSHALETLKDAKLKTSRIGSFNDSFEFLYVSVGKTTREETRRYVNSKLSDPALVFDLIQTNQKSANPITDAEIKRRLNESACSLEGDVVNYWPENVKKTELSIESRRQIIDRELRAVCFSDPGKVKRADEILLWSHYANRHKGVRIGFEFPDGIKEPFEIREITYRNDRPEVVWSLEGESGTLMALEQSATVKCEVWRYEQEFRMFTKTTFCEAREIKKCDSTTTMEHFLGFPREWVKSVDFGVFCSHADIQPIIDLLKTDYPNAVTRRAEFHETEYALEYRQVVC